MIEILLFIVILFLVISIIFFLLGLVSYIDPTPHYATDKIVYISIFRFIKLMIDPDTRKYMEIVNTTIYKYCRFDYEDNSYCLFFKRINNGFFYIFFYFNLLYNIIKEYIKSEKNRRKNTNIIYNTENFNNLVKEIKNKENEK